MNDSQQPLLQLRDVTTVFPTQRGEVRAVEAVNLTVRKGQILGLVGESGCGKSTVLLSILGLIAHPGRIEKGEILFEGVNLLERTPRQMRSLRGKDIAMIFQDPQSTLNPAFPVGEQIRESLRLHNMMPGAPWPFDRNRKAQEKKRVLEVMSEVGIPAAADRYRMYPHEFSGGMQQRALTAIGLACNPKVLLADEPTTALDVTIQAQIVALMQRINREHDTAIILVTHDLGLASEFCDQIAVMYAGRIVEIGPTNQVIDTPQHPYTEGLLRCIPNIGQRRPIEPIPGSVPDLANLGPGCAFSPRCRYARPVCDEGFFRLQPVPSPSDSSDSDGGQNHWARCLRLTDYQIPQTDR